MLAVVRNKYLKKSLLKIKDKDVSRNLIALPMDWHIWQLIKVNLSRFVLCCSHTASGETPTLDTIDSYMKKLHSIIVSNPQEHENLINTVRDVVNRLDR